jgi:hypothetical protein
MAHRNGRDRSTAPYDFPVAVSNKLSTNSALVQAVIVRRWRGDEAVYKESTRARARGQHGAEHASRGSRRPA